MSHALDAEIRNQKALIERIDIQFACLHSGLAELIKATPVELLYRCPRLRSPRQPPGTPPVRSVGEHIVRSAAGIEQTFGGLTANLWDDPFEWTQPEVLSTPERVAEYLDEVEATRRRAFERFVTDADLLKEIAVPAGDRRPLIDLLLETLVRAAEHQGRAVATLALFDEVRIFGIFA